MTDRVDNETALEEVMGFLADPPVPGTPEDALFGARLRQVLAASIVDDPIDEDDPIPKAELALNAELRARLEAAAGRRGGSPFGEHPEGIGPTLGMDLRRS
jgi:hypothetical protein